MSFPSIKISLNKLHFAVLGALALAAGIAHAQSSSTVYELRFPARGLVASSPGGGDGAEGGGGSPVVAPVTLSLAAATLPEGTVGAYYDFDLGSLLTIGGDYPPALNDVQWQIDGTLPANINLVNGRILTGTPSMAGSSTFEVVATHEDAEGRQVFTIVVNGVELQVTQISAGDNHTCAVTAAGAAMCWGAGGSGQLGNGGTANSSAPVNVTGLGSGVTQISAGGTHTCAVTTAGAAMCWGAGGSGQLGNGGTADSTTPVSVTGLGASVTQISAGSNHTCAVHNGAAECWGHGGDGRLGDNSTTQRNTPVAVSGLTSGVASIAANTTHTCAVTTAGAAMCWGANAYGQLGDDSTTQRNTPAAVSGLTSGVASITGGFYHTCAVTTAGAAMCWGANAYGQLGDNSTTQRLAPVAVSGLTSGVASITAGANHACAVTTTGVARCWGRNNEGQLGDSSTTQRWVPVAVFGLASGVASITAGVNHTCAVTTAGAARCWGRNSRGQLGDNSTTQRNTPVEVQF